MTAPSILDRCHSILGPLKPDARRRLQAALQTPTAETWEAAHSIIIRTTPTIMTLWQAWIAVDAFAPRVGRTLDAAGNVVVEWPRVPDSFTLHRALRGALFGKEAA